ncbi:MAG: hypothetical protein NVV66_18400 [Cellulomonas sp.]|uniref:hypothetical protein n=1 Tax=Cellulomonas sp. TaxID=40001 RepID=UPI0025900089|nr:hypothetical protein [Cellulomonas sp.]MCR6706569.1 hypothetical protein [Cellulomonas sp.]
MRIRLSLTLDVERARAAEPGVERDYQLDAQLERADERRIGFTADPPTYADRFDDGRR